MLEDQIDIIYSEGEPVTFLSRTPTSGSYALITQLEKNASPNMRIEAVMRNLCCLASDSVVAGEIIQSDLTNLIYVTVSRTEDAVENVVLKTVHAAYLTNATMTVAQEVESADQYGNITKTFNTVVSGLPVYADVLNDGLKINTGGLIPTTHLRVYSIPTSGTLQDRVQLELNNTLRNFTIQSVDDLSYPNIHILEMISDERA